MSIRETNMVNPNIYWDSGHIRGRCSVCYDTKQHRRENQTKYFKPWYSRVYEKIDEYRGHDKYLGMICRQCIQDGRIVQVNKFHPNQLEED